MRADRTQSAKHVTDDIITLSHVGLMISAQSKSWKSRIHLVPKLHKSFFFFFQSSVEKTCCFNQSAF